MGSLISHSYLLCSPYHNQTLAVSGAALLLVLWSAARAALARFLLTALIASAAMFMIFIAASRGFEVVGEPPAKLMMVLVMGLLALWHPPASAWFRSKSSVVPASSKVTPCLYSEQIPAG